MDTDLRQPDDIAKHFVDKCGNGKSVIGETIDVWSHDSVEDSKVWHEEKGVDPAHVTFISRGACRDFTNILAHCPALERPDLVPNKKFGVYRLSAGTTDDANFTVEFFETDWNTFKRVKDTIQKPENLGLRHDLSHIDPERNQLPQSMALHFLVRFADGSVLAMQRKRTLEFHGGKWSFSAEEQLKEEDWHVHSVGPAEFLFRRAFVEEIFGRRESDPEIVNAVWRDHCADIIRSHRLWSVLLEERLGCFASFGVFQLACNAPDLRDIHRSAGAVGQSRDDEGPFHVVSEEGIGKLLWQGTCEAPSLHGHKVSLITSGELHPTSRYRLWRLYWSLPPERRWRPPDEADVALPAQSFHGVRDGENRELTRVLTLVATDEDQRKILAIANNQELRLEDKMLAIGQLDPAWKGKKSKPWGNLLGVTPNRIRQTATWKQWRKEIQDA